MSRRLRVVSSAYLLLYGAVALTLAYWGVVRATGLLAREDNPRLVEAELRVQRGRILDRDGVVLAQTVGEPGALERVYPEVTAFSPAVGTYSLRYGVSGIEASYDDVLRGVTGSSWQAWWEGLVHRNPAGRDVHLTLDAEVLAAAVNALGRYRGAAVVLDARSGDVLALVSRPSYDPNELDEQFETLNQDRDAPLLSRSTQALYQPGTALQPLLMAIAIEYGRLEPDAAVDDLGAPVQVGDARLACASSPGDAPATVAAAMAHGCPAPFVTLGAELGAEALNTGLAALGLFESPALPVPVAASTRPELASQGQSLAAEMIGQGQMTVSPLHMAWALAAIANEGELPTLKLVRRVGSGEVVIPQPRAGRDGLSAGAAAAVTQVMLEAVESGAAREAALEGVEAAGHVGVAIAGPGGARNTWFLGIAPATAPEPFTRYVVVVLLEEASDPAAAARVGRAIFESVLE
jgi:peptidoglycan glycosyltransferase